MKALLFAICVFGALAASSTTITITDDEPAVKNMELSCGVRRTRKALRGCGFLYVNCDFLYCGNKA